MNYSIIFKVLSLLLLVIALAFSACAGVSFMYADSPIESAALETWICLIALSSMFSFALYLPSRNAPKKLFRKEALCIIGLGWILISLVGSIPYILILDCPFADAFFESSSGITTTGASVFGDFSEFPKSLMFWRCLSHWIGGLGIVVFFVAILSFLGAGGRILYSRESSVNSGGGLETERIRSGTMKILYLYLSISALCLLSFKLAGMGWFDGICHMFSTVSTGGFSVYEDSIAHYDSLLINWVVIIFMFIGGISFAAILPIVRLDFKKILASGEFWTYFLLIFCWGTLISLIITDDMSGETFGESITHSFFQTVSLITTTGFASTDYQSWIPATHVMLFGLMIIGGCAGSTSGGIKVSRLVGSFKLCRRQIEHAFRPKVVRNVSLNGRTIDENDATDILSYVVLYALAILIAFTALAIFEPNLSFQGCISALITTVGNVGPGFGEVGPDKTYAFMAGHSKMLLSVLMIMGRLEFYAVIALFMPSLWKKFE